LSWRDTGCHYVLRRIAAEDAERGFITGFDDFDAAADPADYGTLRDYWRRDHEGIPPTFAYALIDDFEDTVLGILRYRCEDDQPSAHKLSPGDGPYIYLSRIGIAHDHQGTRLSRMLLEFFNHLVLTESRQRALPRIVIWWKCVERTLTLIRPFMASAEVEIFDQKWSENWGREYYLKLEIDF
jgi:GNAT superfamily N-acetyltransferase